MMKEVQYYAGDYLEVDIIPFRKKARSGRGPRTKPTREAQERLNQENRERSLYMLIHENFTNRDYAVHPTYSDAYLPTSEEEALRDRRNFSNRLKRLYKKHGAEFKAVFVLEKTMTGRYHHHMIFSGGVPREEIERIWGMGICNVRGLQFSEHGLEGLSTYIVKSLKGKEDIGERCTFKSYSHTRNLRKPAEPKVKAISQKEFDKLWLTYDSRELFEEKYKDYFFVEASRTDNIEHGERYLRIKLCRRDARLDYISDTLYSGFSSAKRSRGRAFNSRVAERIPPHKNFRK